MSGKGSGRRPTEVSEQAFADNWSRIFNSGLPERSKGTDSNSVTGIAPNSVGSNPTAAAKHECIYRNPRGDYDHCIICDRIRQPGDWLHHKLTGSYEKPVYIDAASGKQVSENWWPGDKIEDK